MSIGWIAEAVLEGELASVAQSHDFDQHRMGCAGAEDVSPTFDRRRRGIAMRGGGAGLDNRATDRSFYRLPVSDYADYLEGRQMVRAWGGDSQRSGLVVRRTDDQSDLSESRYSRLERNGPHRFFLPGVGPDGRSAVPKTG